jgi:sec-independent protein translocase protein TatA
MVGNLMGGDGLIVLVVAIVVLVGGSQLPKIARNLGLAGKEFRKAQHEAEDEERDRAAKAAAPPPPQAVGPVSQAPAAGEESVTLSKSELDALLQAREEQARREASGSST